MKSSLTYGQLKQAAEKFGTPLYVYHAEKIVSQYQNLVTNFDMTQTRFFYACKALTNIHILQVVKNAGCPIDCSSINEVKLALHVGFEPKNILYTSNSVSFDEICEAVSLGINVNIDSLSNLGKFGAKFGNTYAVGVRIRPNIMAGGNLKISTGHDKSKFGIPVAQLEALKLIQEKYQINILPLRVNFGDHLAEIVTRQVLALQGLSLDQQVSKSARLLAIGSVLQYSADDDHIWGTGWNGKVPEVMFNLFGGDVVSMFNERNDIDLADFSCLPDVDCRRNQGDVAARRLRPTSHARSPVRRCFFMNTGWARPTLWHARMGPAPSDGAITL